MLKIVHLMQLIHLRSLGLVFSKSKYIVNKYQQIKISLKLCSRGLLRTRHRTRLLLYPSKWLYLKNVGKSFKVSTCKARKLWFLLVFKKYANTFDSLIWMHTVLFFFLRIDVTLKELNKKILNSEQIFIMTKFCKFWNENLFLRGAFLLLSLNCGFFPLSPLPPSCTWCSKERKASLWSKGIRRAVGVNIRQICANIPKHLLSVPKIKVIFHGRCYSSL